MKLQVAEVFKPFYTDKFRYWFLKGGRGSGKSWAVVDRLLYEFIKNPMLNVACIREVQKSIKHSSKKLIEDRIKAHGLDELFHITKDGITCVTGGGVMIFQGLQDHTADSIKSLEGFDIAWIEEAQTITKYSLSLLTPTIRKEGSEIWFTFNPRRMSDAVEVFMSVTAPQDKVGIIHANYLDIPFTSTVIEDEANALRAVDEEAYKHVFLGMHEGTSTLSIIKTKWLKSAIVNKESHPHLYNFREGESYIGYDVADKGDDYNSAVCIKNVFTSPILTDSINFNGEEDEMVRGVNTVRVFAKACGSTMIQYDNIGVGASVGSIGKNLVSGCKYVGWSASNKPINGRRQYKSMLFLGAMEHKEDDGRVTKKISDTFRNLKSQGWFTIAHRLINTYSKEVLGYSEIPDDICFYIDDKCENLGDIIEQLTAPLEVKDGMGRLLVESKVDMKKRGIASPNIADAIIIGGFPLDNNVNGDTLVHYNTIDIF